LVCAYAAAVVWWRDPVTDLYAAWKQRGLDDGLAAASARYEDRARALSADFMPVAAPAATGEQAAPAAPAKTPAVRPAAAPDGRKVKAAVGVLAGEFAREYRDRTGAALGELRIPRLGVGTIFVQGTDYWGALAKGPGRYERTAFPGQGKVIGVAGHRTTFSAPFRKINVLKAGDTVELEMPYGTFRYRVTSHKIVDDGDWSIIEPVGHEQLVLSACHPLYSAAQRWVVFAKLDAITLPGGPSVPV
jgi:LPXTG-site transpeptidase (sortase) family protein